MKVTRAGEVVGDRSFVGVRDDGFDTPRILGAAYGGTPAGRTAAAPHDALLVGSAGSDRLPFRLRRDGVVERPHLVQLKGEPVQLDVTMHRHLDVLELTAALAAALATVEDLSKRIAALELLAAP